MEEGWIDRYSAQQLCPPRGYNRPQPKIIKRKTTRNNVIKTRQNTTLTYRTVQAEHTKEDIPYVPIRLRKDDEPRRIPLQKYAT